MGAFSTKACLNGGGHMPRVSGPYTTPNLFTNYSSFFFMLIWKFIGDWCLRVPWVENIFNNSVYVWKKSLTKFFKLSTIFLVTCIKLNDGYVYTHNLVSFLDIETSNIYAKMGCDLRTGSRLLKFFDRWRPDGEIAAVGITSLRTDGVWGRNEGVKEI